MNRRKFLSASLAATTGGILVAADVLSAKTFFLPPAGGWRPYASDILYGSHVGPYYVDGSMIQAVVKGSQLQLYDVVAVNGRPHRVTAMEYLQDELGHPIERLDLVRIDTGVRLIS